MSLKSPTGRLARWALQLQPYNFTIEYMPGRTNIVADMLSRPPCNNQQHQENKCEICNFHIDEAQLQDDQLKTIIGSFESNDENISRWTSRGYILNDGILYTYSPESDSETAQLVIPLQERQSILHNYHDAATAGHYGIDRTFSRIASRYYWPGMRNDITKHIGKYLACLRYKPSNMKPTGLVQTVASNQRFEVLSVDLFGPLPATKDGCQWILIAEDLASRWVEVFALKEATAENCAMTLLNDVFLRYGIPRRLLTDNGSQFISALMQQLTHYLGIQQTLTPVYHPEANPVERKNRDMKTQLAILVGNNHTAWAEDLPSIRFAMNTALMPKYRLFCILSNAWTRIKNRGRCSPRCKKHRTDRKHYPANHSETYASG